jgi:Domain of unknown function (DUF4129)
VPRHQTTKGLLLGGACLGIALFLGGLATTLELGNATVEGFLLIPALPTSLYVVMTLVVLACVVITFLISFLRRRKPSAPEQLRQSETTKTPWQVAVSMLASAVLLLVCILWLARHGSHLQEWLQRWRAGLEELQASLQANPLSVIQQFQSPVAGYALFFIVVVVYGGIALLGLWVLFDTQSRAAPTQTTEESQQARRVRRAVAGGLRELQQVSDPRQAIIACYARLEHLLEDHGVPLYDTLTPQEYMGTALQGLDLPIDAFAGLVQLFELARYSLHPLDETARQAAMTHLETIQSHLEWEAALATRA